jgi:hypothetical protein
MSTEERALSRWRSKLKAKGLLGKIQRRIHDDLRPYQQGATMTTGTLNFPEHFIENIDENTAPQLEAILRKARADITALLETKR